MITLKVVEVRLKESTLEWVKKQADKEKIAISTMIRTFLEREEFRDEIEKNLKNKKRK